jgi:hypothetical protein
MVPRTPFASRVLATICRSSWSLSSGMKFPLCCSSAVANFGFSLLSNPVMERARRWRSVKYTKQHHLAAIASGASVSGSWELFRVRLPLFGAVLLPPIGVQKNEGDSFPTAMGL